MGSVLSRAPRAVTRLSGILIGGGGCLLAILGVVWIEPDIDRWTWHIPALVALAFLANGAAFAVERWVSRRPPHQSAGLSAITLVAVVAVVAALLGHWPGHFGITIKGPTINGPVAFPPTLQLVGGGIGAAIGWGFARYYYPKRRWIELLLVMTGFLIGQIIASILLGMFGLYEPIVR